MIRRHVLASAAALAAGGLALAACGGTPTAGRQVVSPAATTRSTTASTTTSACTGMPTVTATALGEASAQPDTLLLDLGVQTKAPTVAAALSSADAKAARLVAVLRSAGVPASDVQTTNLSIGASYNAKGVNAGYSVTNTVSVTDPKITSASKIIDSAVGAAGNSLQFDNLQFAVSNDTTPAIEARIDAVKRAEGRAEAMATAAGSSLGHLCSISDATSPVYYPLAGNSGALGLRSAGGASGSASAATPVESGSQTVTAQVTVVFALG